MGLSWLKGMSGLFGLQPALHELSVAGAMSRTRDEATYSSCSMP